MIFGPFSTYHLDRLCSLLDRAGVAYKIDFSPEEIERWRQEQRQHQPNAYPSFQGPVEALFIEIGDADVLRLKEQLNEFGIAPEEDRPTELDAFEDFVCPKCSFSGHSHRLCPKHRVPLIPYSQKIKQRDRIGGALLKSLIWALLAFLIAAEAYSCSGHRPLWPWQRDSRAVDARSFR